MADKTGNDPIDIFLCHNSADKDWVRTLGERIEQEDWHGRKLRVFFDEWDIQLGENILRRIEEGLKQCRFLGVVLSPEMTRADWPTLEWNAKIYDDPSGKRGQIIPILLRDRDLETGERIEVPLPLRILSRLDFREKRSFSKEYNRLLRRLRNEPPSRGRTLPGQSIRGMHPATAAQVVAGLPIDQDEPDPVEEILLANLLPVLLYPNTIWSASTEARKPKDVWEIVENNPPFRLLEKRLYTFINLQNDNPFDPVIDKTSVRPEAVGPWVYDQDKWKWFLYLMHQSLKSWCYHHAMLENKGRYFFRPALDENGQEVDRKYKGFYKGRSRTVAKKCTKPDGSIFWAHQGVKLRFETLGERLYLQVDPCWVFTSDGKNVLTGKVVGPLSTKWGGKEQNGPILRHMTFWAHVLSNGKVKIVIPAGGGKIVIGRIPSLTNIDVGIESDHLHINALVDQIENEIDLATDMLEIEEFAHDEEYEDIEEDI